MADHDLLAELRAYRVELAEHETYGRTERAKLTRAGLAGVVTAVMDKVKQLTNQAELHEAQGADVPAAQARVEARRFQTALDEHAPGEPLEDTASSTPLQRAVPPRGRTS